jgi:hypothetical protein
MSWAVWYHSAGSLPDHENGPEYTGTREACEGWMVEHASEYDTSVLYNLYAEPYEEFPTWDARHAELAASMVGFTDLTLSTQGLLVGMSMEDQVWHTPNRNETRLLAKHLVASQFRLTEAWGVEK